MQYQEFNGIRFYQTEPTDYFRHSVNGTTILMHRYVWEFYNCKIPKGYHVHHRDGNKANNDISNLALLYGAEHWKLHGKLLTDEEREWRRQISLKMQCLKPLSGTSQKQAGSGINSNMKRQRQRYIDSARSLVLIVAVFTKVVLHRNSALIGVNLHTGAGVG